MKMTNQEINYLMKMNPFNPLQSIVRGTFTADCDTCNFEFLAGEDSILMIDELPIQIYPPFPAEKVHRIQIGNFMDVPLIAYKLACGIYNDEGKLVSAHRTTHSGFFSVTLEAGRKYRVKLAPRYDDEEQRQVIDQLAEDGDPIAESERSQFSDAISMLQPAISDSTAEPLLMSVVLRKELHRICDRRLTTAASSSKDPSAVGKPVELFELLQAVKSPTKWRFQNANCDFVVTGKPQRQLVTVTMGDFAESLCGKEIALEVATVGRKENLYKWSKTLVKDILIYEFFEVPSTGIVGCRVLLDQEEAVRFFPTDTGER